MTEFGAQDKLECVERELRFRRVVYARRVDRQVMSKEQMDHEIRCMEAIAADYREQVRATEPELFNVRAQ